MTVFSFALAAVMLAAACIPADRVRGWRESVNPSAPELPDSAFVVARIVFVVMAGLVVYATINVMRLSN
ncbi:hypothetical protein ACIQAC_29665 [Streptomyces sp. NPDC088387]|uniref:hypothetical protein n=1 Tax=Streptomyces sp. NPDC088387 TaxID=3365859 RepID=UPI00382868CA